MLSCSVSPPTLFFGVVSFPAHKFAKTITTKFLPGNEHFSDMILERLEFWAIRIHVIHEIKSSGSKIKSKELRG
jgi:hypothetical protein